MDLTNAILLSQADQITLISELQRELSNLNSHDLCSVITYMKQGLETAPDNTAGDVYRRIQLITMIELNNYFYS